MDKEYLTNPLNRRKKKYKYYLRKFENLFKKALIFTILFPISLPFLIKNYLFSNLYFFKDFINQNGSVFFVIVLKKLYNCKFLIKINDFDKVLNRFGLVFTLNNFCFNCGFKKYKQISFKDKNSEIFLNSDYFIYFDKHIKPSKNNFVLPFYLPKNFYLKDSYQKLNSNKKKKIKIIFSGSIHKEWYGNLNFLNEKNKRFLNRVEIVDILKENFADLIEIVKNQSDYDKVKNSNKEIVILETNPEISLRKKGFSEKQHLDLISDSKFFLCMPGTSMPLCYHLIESCMVGTVPILSYNNFLSPKFKDNEALFYFKKSELIETINQALNMDEAKYLVMHNKILDFYDEHLNPNHIGKKLQNKNYPLEIFINMDHISTKRREERIPEMKKKFV
jgi:hypothetical protein